MECATDIGKENAISKMKDMPIFYVEDMICAAKILRDYVSESDAKHERTEQTSKRLEALSDRTDFLIKRLKELNILDAKQPDTFKRLFSIDCKEPDYK